MMKKQLLLLTLLLACQIGKATEEYFTVNNIVYEKKDATTVMVANGSMAAGACVIPATVSDGSADYQVTEIGTIAFMGNTNITSIQFPNTLTEIKDQAFYNCTNLTSISWGTGLKKIGNFVFANDQEAQLSSVTIPDGVEEIGRLAVLSKALTTVTLPPSIKKMSYGAFSCSQRRTIQVNISDLTSFCNIEVVGGELCFDNYSLILNGKEVTDLSVPATVTKVGTIFSGCTSLKSLTFHEGVTEIAGLAFLVCGNIKQVVACGATPADISDMMRFEDAVKQNATLYVPKGKTVAYKNAGWTFENVVEATSFVPGDANGNGSVGGEDIDAIKDRIMTGKEPDGFVPPNADLNADGKIDAADIVLDVNIVEDKVTHDDWDWANSYMTITDIMTLWHVEYLYVKGGVENRKVFEFIEGRGFGYDGPWTSVEDNNSYETSAGIHERAKTEPKEESQNGAVATWNCVTYDIHCVVTLNGSKMQDKWTAIEGRDFSVTYRGKTFNRFANYDPILNNEASLADKGVSGDYRVWGYTNELSYKWGDNTRTSTATGTIKVAEPTKSDRFFMPEWGDLLEAKQTVSNNRAHNGYVYVWSLRFAKGVLPVILSSGDTTPNFQFELFEYTSVKDYNSATYNEGTWVNSKASDNASQMVWEREGAVIGSKDYSEAAQQNWDEGHTHDGHVSVHTNRYQLDVEDGYLTATNTYTGKFMGGWK